VVAGPAFSVDFSLDFGIGGTYEGGDNTVPADPGSVDGQFEALLNILTAFRIGGFADFRLNLFDPVSAGAELGAFAFVGADEGGEATVTPLIDLPVRAFVRATLGTVAIQAHVGYNFATAFDLTTESGLGIIHKFELGARLTWVTVYLEVSKLFWTEGRRSGRVGLGVHLRDIEFGR
jgi:hypothetical protein